MARSYFLYTSVLEFESKDSFFLEKVLERATWTSLLLGSNKNTICTITDNEFEFLIIKTRK